MAADNAESRGGGSQYSPVSMSFEECALKPGADGSGLVGVIVHEDAASADDLASTCSSGTASKLG